MAKKKPRGKNLDERLKKELELMLNDGFKSAPISRSAIQRRLGLTSRGTLAIKQRAELIEHARKLQLENAGLSESGKVKRSTSMEQNIRLKEKIILLEKDRDALLEKLAMIINGI